MDNKYSDSLGKARNYAFLLLKFRPRSEKELGLRLKKKKFDAEIIERTIAFLKEKKFIDDDAFARAWIESRIKKPLGLRRLREELKLKGINKEIIGRHIEEAKKNYSEADLVRKITVERFNKLKGVDSRKAKQRVFSYLARRGFSPEVIMDALNQFK